MYPAASLFRSMTPMEMTNLTKALTTFAYYELVLPSSDAAASKELSVGTHQAMAMSAYIDGAMVGMADEHSHGNGKAVTLKIDLTSSDGKGQAASSLLDLRSTGSENGTAVPTLTILAEELGYANYGFKNELFKVSE
jgi:hypothetical protein